MKQVILLSIFVISAYRCVEKLDQLRKVEMIFDETVREYKVVQLFDELQPTTTMRRLFLNNNTLRISEGDQCDFSGTWTSDNERHDLAVTFTSEIKTGCSAEVNDFSLELGQLSQPDNGYSLHLRGYGSDWAVVGYENVVSKKLDIMIGARLLENTLILDSPLNP